jgi:uroporphyrin-III C-methyltransferase
MHKLKEIVTLYQNNRTDDLPVAIIQNGTTENQKMVIGTVSSIVDVVQEHKLASPAIIIIGEVVKNPSKLSALYSEAASNDEFVFQNLNEIA